MYTPLPIDTSEIFIDQDILELIELIANNTHDVWAESRIEEGWIYGPTKDSNLKTTPDLVPYEDLPESEKEYDRKTAMEAIKILISLGYKITKNPEGGL